MSLDYVLSDDIESELKARYGSIIKLSPKFKDPELPELYVFRDILNKDILEANGVNDTYKLFSRVLIFPKLNNKELVKLKNIYFGFIETSINILLKRYNEPVEYADLEMLFNMMDFELYDTSGISILIQAIGADKIDIIFDLIMNHNKSYVQKLAHFAAKFSGLESTIIKQKHKSDNKSKLQAKLRGGEVQEEEDVVARYKKNKFKKYNESIAESKALLEEQIIKDSMNKYRRKSIDFDKELTKAMESGVISKDDLDRDLGFGDLYDPKNLTKGTLLNQLLVKSKSPKG